MRALQFLLAGMILVSIPIPVASGIDLNGWCMPDDGCDGPIPFRDGRFDQCEASCKLTNPVSVRDMDATLYDVSCVADFPFKDRRWFVGKYIDWQDKEHVIIVEHDRFQILERCE